MEKTSRPTRKFLHSLGPVEQSQVVASTAVVVMMGTILAVLMLTEDTVRPVDFFSILAVGLIGFTSVYFTLQYGRQIDAKRRQLAALNTIADSVNRITEINHVLRNALEKVTELLGGDLGWIYLLEGDALVLKSVRGTDLDFLSLSGGDRSSASWLRQPRVERERLPDSTRQIHPALKEAGIQFWTSVPLASKDTVAGVLVIAGKDFDLLSASQAELMESFGKQISIALNNARLFDLLRQSEEQYHDLFENAPDCYLTIDPSCRIVACNKTGADMLGYPREQMLGKPFDSFCTQPRGQSLRETIERMINTRLGIKDLEEELVRADGETLAVNLNFSLVIDEAGRPVNARVIARDITQRKNMERAILHAQKIDSIGNLAGGVAHDFNNILAAILGAASIMRRRLTEKAKLYKYVEIIEGASRRGSSLTRQLLTFARKTETRSETVDVNTIIRETLHLVERSFTKVIALRTRLTEEATGVRGDAGQIQQALLNLFLNARDAMPDGGTLSVSSDVMVADAHTTSQFTSVKPGPFVRVTVTDTGVGMDKATQTRIFEPFFTTKDTGTGIGLSVLYGVVQNHGGFVNLESEVAQGSTFSLYLPREGTPTSATPQRRQRLPRGTEHLLVIDDELSICEIARDMLGELGYTVTFAHDGKAGVEKYCSRQGSIDLVLLDVNMPLMGGRATFERLRSANPALRIIILTGYGQDLVDQEGFVNEANSFLQKPFHVEDLAMKVRQVLDISKSAPLTTA